MSLVDLKHVQHVWHRMKRHHGIDVIGMPARTALRVQILDT
jgi:hypothetical protein